jgi:hypothetical protein
MVADTTRGVIQRRLMGQCESSLGEESEFLSNFIWAALTNWPAASQA